jgi:integrase
MAGVDTKTRYQGVFARHRLHCAIGEGKRCNCKPSYYGVVWDKEAGKHRKTKRRPKIAEARSARLDLRSLINEGGTVDGEGLRFNEAHRQFIQAARDGIALNKHGKPYKPNAITDLDSSLKRVPAAIQRERLGDVARGQVQRMVDDLRRTGLSGSRIRSIVNAVRSLYRWAQEHELVVHDPAAIVRLPANDSEARDRIATPGEFAALLAVLDGRDALPWALAGYGSARSQEIRALEWPEVDFAQGVILLAADDAARKSEKSRRIVPLVRPLLKRLREEWLAQGRPTKGRVCPPRRESRSGKVSLDQLQKAIRQVWEGKGLEPIGLQDSRHTTATWLDHAGVSPKVASTFMGHKAPKAQPDAAPITLGRYTHVLAGELERARDLLDRFLAERSAESLDSVKRHEP